MPLYSPSTNRLAFRNSCRVYSITCLSLVHSTYRDGSKPGKKYCVFATLAVNAV